MSQLFPTNLPYKVADMSLAEFGRKEIEIAVKAGGSDPSGNTRLRILIQNAKAENMPKENVERAIKRATEKDAADYKEVIYEGYGPHGVAVMVETATDNTNRTVANVRLSLIHI